MYFNIFIYAYHPPYSIFFTFRFITYCYLSKTVDRLSKEHNFLNIFTRERVYIYFCKLIVKTVFGERCFIFLTCKNGETEEILSYQTN